MGQEQSSGGTSSTTAGAQDDGVRLVEGSGSALQQQTEKTEADMLLQQSSALAIPQPLLPPPPVEDNISSALQGAQMMHEIRTLLGGLLVSEQDAPSLVSSSLHSNASTNSNAPAGKSANSEPDTTATQSEQDTWARFGIDAETLDKVIADCTGGERMRQFVGRQNEILQKMKQIAELAARLKAAVDLKTEQARRTSRAIEKLDRVSMSITEMQETLEEVVATANILGAAHFADDPEMSSFKTFLQRNPPDC